MHAWEQIQVTVDYIEDHIGEEISVEKLSRLASLSPFYYQRLFTRLVGKPVMEYVRLRRMALSTELLTNTQRILDVALKLGFSSHEHFTRVFKDTFGMTPAQYRSNPKPLNRMTKPQLLLHYVLIDEGVPLVTDGIVIEIKRHSTSVEESFIGIDKLMPAEFVDGLGTESGEDPFCDLWDSFHAQKGEIPGLSISGDEIGVTLPSTEKGCFSYFAGGAADANTLAAFVQTNQLQPLKVWTLPAGDYIVCIFEAENFESLVMDALYKANQYLYNIWLPQHAMNTEPFCVERYKTHSPDTTSMEIWVKLKDTV